MDENRKAAYRYLVYWAMLEIRPIAWTQVRWRSAWNPFYWRFIWRQMHYAGSIADWMHNLALFSSVGLERFDENRFWNDLSDIQRRYPEFNPGRFKTIFDDHLSKLENERESNLD